MAGSARNGQLEAHLQPTEFLRAAELKGAAIRLDDVGGNGEAETAGLLIEPAALPLPAMRSRSRDEAALTASIRGRTSAGACKVAA